MDGPVDVLRALSFPCGAVETASRVADAAYGGNIQVEQPTKLWMERTTRGPVAQRLAGPSDGCPPLVDREFLRDHDGQATMGGASERSRGYPDGPERGFHWGIGVGRGSRAAPSGR